MTLTDEQREIFDNLAEGFDNNGFPNEMTAHYISNQWKYVKEHYPVDGHVYGIWQALAEKWDVL